MWKLLKSCICYVHMTWLSIWNHIYKKEHKMKFYCVKTGQEVFIADSKCVKTKYPRKRGTGFCFCVKAVDKSGNKLVSFVKEEVWKALKCKEV